MYETEVHILITQSEITDEPFLFKGELDEELGIDGCDGDLDESSRTGSQKHIRKLFKISWLGALLGVHGPEILKDF